MPDPRLFNGELKLEELPRSWAHYTDPGAGEPAGVLNNADPHRRERMAVHVSLMPVYVTLEPEGLPPQRDRLHRPHQSAVAAVHRLAGALAEAARAAALPAPPATLPWAARTSRWRRTGRANWWKSHGFQHHARAHRPLRQRAGYSCSAVSPIDLRTPITRLRLRVELLEDEPARDKFSHDLDELELPRRQGALLREAMHRHPPREYRAGRPQPVAAVHRRSLPRRWPGSGHRRGARALSRQAAGALAAASATCWTRVEAASARS